MKTISTTALLAALFTSVVGCSGKKDEGPARVKATGSVTYKGQPVEGASVVLAPEPPGQHPATAVTDSSGQFALGTNEAGDGAVPGKYKVGVSKNQVSSSAAPAMGENDYSPEGIKTTTKSLLPAKYGNPNKSGLTAEIRDGEDNVLPAFELKD